MSSYNKKIFLVKHIYIKFIKLFKLLNLKIKL